VDWYDVLTETDATAGLRPQVVLRWRNAERINRERQSLRSGAIRDVPRRWRASSNMATTSVMNSARPLEEDRGPRQDARDLVAGQSGSGIPRCPRRARPCRRPRCAAAADEVSGPAVRGAIDAAQSRRWQP